ncbi:hypothetical protein PUMCH_001440 [Australozyma saopauloensis]|uniref:DUF866-domain-containing protein n=1 Tax=Australozyma saopauloensis TaxID=291208 RepID=A0AAX4H871_9ASCO|nr:hypothetical protein PUMCH_001440 [[Candida] saopauloensis]
MVKFYLKAKGYLEHLNNVQPLDNAESPYEYIFIIECTKCREEHNKPVSINRFEQHEISGSRGEASFVFRCKACKSEHSALILRTAEKITADNNGEWARILEIDARGIDFKRFVPEGRWEGSGLETDTKFDEIDLEEGEWFDYDEKAKEMAGITEVEFDIARL